MPSGRPLITGIDGPSTGVSQTTPGVLPPLAPSLAPVLEADWAARMAGRIMWPLLSNVIRRNSLQNTYGRVPGRHDVHQGWDLHAPVGTTCYSVATGKVELVIDVDESAYGKQVCMSFEATI